MPERTIEKVVAYVTNAGRLLVFSHPYAPDAGIQVPAGTVEPGEAGEVAVLREAGEETGLARLEVVAYLGEQTVDLRPFGTEERHRRRFYHLRCPGQPPPTWRHEERFPSDAADAEAGPIVFEFSWAPLPAGVPELAAGQGALLDVLVARVSGTGA